jgi:hypothetical protein
MSSGQSTAVAALLPQVLTALCAHGRPRYEMHMLPLTATLSKEDMSVGVHLLPVVAWS